MAEAATAMRRS